MELLLNLAWLLLALPAYWLWRECSGVQRRRHISSAQCLLALGCLLVVLFPVVSATDDLHAMRSEMEESSSSKRGLRQSNPNRPAPGKWHTNISLASAPLPVIVLDEAWHHLTTPRPVFRTASLPEHPGRAPPSILG